VLKEELHAIVHGNVHGVGFRATAKHHADQLGLFGYVRNCPDGTVEILAQGEKKHLERLIERLHEEFGSGYIQRIESAYRPMETPYHDFKIQRYNPSK
jgi:acylphosphatase